MRTMVGAGGVPGTESDGEGRKFVIDFEGGPLAELSADAELPATVTVLRGVVTEPVSQFKPSDRRSPGVLRPDAGRRRVPSSFGPAWSATASP